MKRSEIEVLGNLGPHARAAGFLKIGTELASERKKPAKFIEIPEYFSSRSVLPVTAWLLMNQMSGPKRLSSPKMETIHSSLKTVAEMPTVRKAPHRKIRVYKTRWGELPIPVLGRPERRLLFEAVTAGAGRPSARALAIRALARALDDRSGICRSCAAYAYWQATGMKDPILPIISESLGSKDDEERVVAAHCLARIDPQAARHLQGSEKDDEPHSPKQTIRDSMTVIIHGTFAKDHEWYKPSGGFHGYIKNSVFPDTYDRSDFYFWSGRYSASDTALKGIWKAAARKLISWVDSHPAKTLRLIAHSHGNNVVNLATQMGLQVCTLIQLSPPVRGWSLPDMSNVSSETLFNIHSTVDLVVLIDGGAQDYRGTDVGGSESRKIIARFGHAKSHVPRLWTRKKVPKLVQTVCP